VGQITVSGDDRRAPLATDGGHETVDTIKVRSTGFDLVGDPCGRLGEFLIYRDDLTPAKGLDGLVDLTIGVVSDADYGLGVGWCRDNPGLVVAAVSLVVLFRRWDTAEIG
jgi:hypothetical protein